MGPRKVEDSKNTGAAYFNKRDHVRYFNIVVLALELIWEAAEDGSPDAQEFLRKQADTFLQKAGALPCSLKEVNMEPREEMDSTSTGVACFGLEDRIRYINIMAVAMDLVGDAAEEGSYDAEEFLCKQADIFLQKAGDLS